MKKILLIALGILFIGIVVGAVAIITQPSKTANGITISSVKIIDIDGIEKVKIDFTGTGKRQIDTLNEYGFGIVNNKVTFDYEEGRSEEIIKFIENFIENDFDINYVKPIPTITIPEINTGKQYDFDDGRFK